MGLLFVRDLGNTLAGTCGLIRSSGNRYGMKTTYKNIQTSFLQQQISLFEPW